MKSSKLEFTDLPSLLDLALSLDYFHKGEDGEEPAIPFRRVDGTSKLVVVTGDNASGKSFFRRIIQLLCRDNEMECIAISAEARRKISYNPWLALVYGDEQTESTGVNSTHTVLTGIRSSQQRDKAHVIFWDEPDIGLSEGWAAGIGQKICAFAQNPSEHVTAAVVVTHSHALLRELIPANPYFLHLGVSADEAPTSLEAWINRKIEPRDPEALPALSRERFRKIQKILDSISKG